MKIIYKYELTGPRTALDLPWGTQTLTAQMQGNRVMLWAIVDQDEQIRTVRRTFAAINTDVSFDLPIAGYIATVSHDNGIVWHVFEVSP